MPSRFSFQIENLERGIFIDCADRYDTDQFPSVKTFVVQYFIGRCVICPRHMFSVNRLIFPLHDLTLPLVNFSTENISCAGLGAEARAVDALAGCAARTEGGVTTS